MKYVFALAAVILLLELVLPHLIALYRTPLTQPSEPAPPPDELQLRIWHKESLYRKERRARIGQESSRNQSSTSSE